MATATQYDVDQLMQEWRINGFVVFEDLIPLDKIERIREAWIPYRDRMIRERDPNLEILRYNVRVPFERPFLDEEIFEHPALVEFLARALGPDYVWTHFDSNNPFPGVDYQDWHRDGQTALFPGVMTPAFYVGVKFPLVDTFEENGSFEIIPGTQYVTDPDLLHNLNSVFGKGADKIGRYYPIRLNLKKGSLWVQDGRAFHRGTPNRSDHVRDELCMALSSAWLHSEWSHQNTSEKIPRDVWNDLSDHARQVLRWQRVED